MTYRFLFLLLFLASCQSDPFKGTWMTQAHDAVYSGEDPLSDRDDIPFGTITITHQAVFIDAEQKTHRWSANRDSLYLVLDGIEHSFMMGKPAEKDGKTYMMMMSDTYTTKDLSMYYLKKIK
jgi:hypothetical protein